MSKIGFHLVAFFVTVAVVAVMLFIITKAIKNNADVFKTVNANIEVVVVDNCEYIVASTSAVDGGLAVVHKENCKNH